MSSPSLRKVRSSDDKPVATGTASTWYACNHETGWLVTAKFLWFKKQYFVCANCGASMEKRVYDIVNKKEGQ